MQAVKRYIKSEWKYWIYGMVASFLFLVFAGTTDAHSETIRKNWQGLTPPINQAVEVARAGTADDPVIFLHNKQANDWYLKYAHGQYDMNEYFDDLTVVWQGLSVDNEPIILIRGQGGTACETNYRLYWLRNNGKVGSIDNFGICNSPTATVEQTSTMITIHFGKVVKRIPLE